MSFTEKTIPTYVIKGGWLVNEGKIMYSDILLKNGRIEKIGSSIDHEGAKEIDAEGHHIIPGIIDDQVHFREPGLTHKGTIASEAGAAVAGGVTSFMEMPNTNPPALTQKLLQEKYDIAAGTSPANYSFFMGVSNDNLEEVMKTNVKHVCGAKVFMGSSTGNMLVDNENTLRQLFSKYPGLIAAHCEDETTIRKNTQAYVEKYGNNIPVSFHPDIRSEEACFKSSSFAVSLAKESGTRLHVLHISTGHELDLFDNHVPLKEKKITSEVCVHHLYFSKKDYERLGTRIKCNPAIKKTGNKIALFEAMLDDRLDIIATDHAPHTLDEKESSYMKAPSGIPLVQHSLNVMLDFYHMGKISLEKVVEKMCHAPSVCFKVKERGFLREGFKADIAIVDVNKEWEVNTSNILYKCGWSPFEGKTFKGKVTHTFVNGSLVFLRGKVDTEIRGERLEFAV